MASLTSELQMRTVDAKLLIKEVSIAYDPRINPVHHSRNDPILDMAEFGSGTMRENEKLSRGSI
jgi:hypothetical protein